MLKPSPLINEARACIDRALIVLRQERKERPAHVEGKDGKRELSEAITLLETAGMFTNRSLFCEVPYSPLRASGRDE